MYKEVDTEIVISVVIPVYNVEKYLERCIESVVNQTYNNLEIIIVNDGSTDASLEVANRMKAKYPKLIIIDQENSGVSSTRNAGMKAANGDYIAFLDSDDWVAPDCYEYMLNLIKKYNADVADIMTMQVDTDHPTVPAVAEKIEIYDGMDILEHYLYRGMKETKGAPFTVWRKLYKRSLFSNEIHFAEGMINEDICFNYKVLSKCKRIVVSNQIKHFYFQRKTGLTNGPLKRRDLDLFKVSDELIMLASKSKNARIIELAKMKRARSDFSILARAARDGFDQNSIDNPEEITSKTQNSLRKNLFLLFKSPMSITRKGLAVLFAINYKLSCKMIRYLKK